MVLFYIDVFFVSVITLGCIFLSALSVAKDSSRALNKVFAFTSISVAIWIITAFLSDIEQLSYLSLFFNRFLLAAVTGVMVGIFYLSLDFPFKKDIPPWIHFFVLTPSVIISVLTVLTPLTIESIRFKEWGTDPVYGVVFSIFGVFASALLLVAMFLFIRNYRKASGLAKLQMKYLFLGLFIFMVINIIVHMIISELLGTVKYYKFGNYSAFFFVFFLGLAVIKHRLMDIRLVVTRTIAYFVVSLLFASFYALCLFYLGRFLFSYQSDISQLIFSTILALLLAFTWPLLYRTTEKVIGRFFYRDRYESDEVLNTLGALLTDTVSLPRLSQKVSDSLTQYLKLSYVHLFVLGKDNQLIKIVEGKVTEVDSDDKWYNFFSKTKSLYIYDELKEGKTKSWLREINVASVLRLHNKKKNVGLLVLGLKENGTAFTSQDISLLEVFSKQLSIAIDNAQQFYEIQKFNETLQGKIVEATKKLRKANEKLKIMDKRKDEFLNVAAHELRAPLTAVKGYLSMIMEGDAGKVTSGVSHFLEGAITGAEREVRLVNNMLNMSRIEENRLVFNIGKVNLSEVVEQVFMEFKIQGEEKGLKLSTDVAKDVKDLVKVDQDRIHEVVANFVSNGVKYTDQGEVTIKMFNKKVEANDWVRVEVSDTGFGMTAEEQKKLFSKFYRAESSAGKVLGTGLGLYITKLLVEKFEGNLGVASEKGKGSTFWFELPVVKK